MKQKYSKKYIYKITNKINGKCYIGQTVNYIKRFSNHKRAKEYKTCLLHRAIRKYGIDNFNFEVIDEATNYNELEKYYIKLYNSIEFGYNISEGGDEPPIISGENSLLATHTQEEINKIKHELKYGNLTFEQIAEKYNYENNSSIIRINNGTVWHDIKENYPLRDITNVLLVDGVINLLKNSNLSQREIALRLDVKRSTVTMINLGENNKRESEVYPIRRKGTIKTKFADDIEKIINLLKNTQKSIKEISNELNVKEDMVRYVNIGKTNKRNDIIYPIRKDFIKEKKDKEFYDNLIIYIINHPNEGLSKIARLFKIGYNTILEINGGKKENNIKYNYPLRKL